MANLLSKLTKKERVRLLEEMNYMNLAEIRGFCTERGSRTGSWLSTTSGKVKVTQDTDRKANRAGACSPLPRDGPGR
jgi:hypothetical protein